MSRIDITGQKFDRLTVIGYSHTNKLQKAIWTCKCICGNVRAIKASNLASGKTRSCGCLRKEERTTHGLSQQVNGKNTILYQKWAGMKGRCENPKSTGYSRYGGRGISVCLEWHSYEIFHKWAIQSGYVRGLSIDRINPNGNYEPANCQWLTVIENSRKRTTDNLKYPKAKAGI